LAVDLEALRVCIGQSVFYRFAQHEIGGLVEGVRRGYAMQFRQEQRGRRQSGRQMRVDWNRGMQ
jgi:hypothetical protein